MFFITITSILLAMVAVTLYRRLLLSQSGRKQPASTIPGLEPRDTQNGNFADISAAGSLHEFLVKMHQEHGPIISFWFGPKYMVSVSDPVMLKDLKDVSNRPPELFQLLATLLTEHSIQFTNYDEWRLRRKTTDHCWGHSMLRHFCGYFNEIAEVMVAKLSSLPDQDHIPLCENALALTIQGLFQTSYGDFSKDDKNCHLLKHNNDVCWNEMEARLNGDIPKPGSERENKFQEALENMRTIMRKIVKGREENPPKPNERAFIDVLMENQDLYTEPKLMADAMTYMAGGFHTTGYLLAWTIYFLTKNQDVQEKIYREVMSIVGPKESISPDDISKFEYMKQVFNETLRLSDLATLGARFQDVDITLGGHFIPKGTTIVTAMGVMGQEEKLWEDPERFDPDRFSAESMKGHHPQAFIPFGLPGRICPGYRFAFYELTVFLAILTRSFKWTLVKGQTVGKVHGLMTRPDAEIWVQVEPRQ